MEGGVLPHANEKAATIFNTTRLRESIHKLLLQQFDETKFKLKIRMGAGEINAKKFFLNSLSSDSNSILIVDVEGKNQGEKIENKEAKLKILELEKESNQVFFMEREMEAWIISQCACIEACARLENWTRIKANQKLEDDSNLRGKIITEIPYPSKKLEIIVKRYYRRINKDNEKVRLQYGKLKHAPTMIEHLILSQLKKDFTEVDRLLDYITNKQ